MHHRGRELLGKAIYDNILSQLVHARSTGRPEEIARQLSSCAQTMRATSQASGCLPLSAAEAKMKSASLLYLVCWRNSVSVVARASHIGTGALPALALVRFKNLPSSEHLFDGDFAFVPQHMTPTKCKKLRDAQAPGGNQQHGNTDWAG
jgi:hypothetical protein